MSMKSVNASKGRLRSTYIAIMIPLGVAINYIGGQLATSLSLPIYMDSIGTAIVAAIMGPWIGAASGVLFNIISSLINGNVMASLFGICNIGTGLIVGYMARYGYYKKLFPDIILATVLVALWNAATGTPIAMAVYGGIDGNAGTNVMIAAFQNMGKDLFSSAFFARIPTNLIDKGIACLTAWLILSKLPENLKQLNGTKAK